MIDDYNMDEHMESPTVYSTTVYQESQGSLVVVVDRTFIQGSVDLRAQAYSLIVAV